VCAGDARIEDYPKVTLGEESNSISIRSLHCRSRSDCGDLFRCVADTRRIGEFNGQHLEYRDSTVPVGSWYALTYGDGQWVALGDAPDVAVSTNGATWNEYPVPAGSWQSVAYGNGRFVALSSTDAASEELVSTNGQSWTAATGPAGPWTAVTFGAGRFVAVSSSGQIDTSTNGTQWSSVWHHSNLDFTSVAYGGGHFVTTDSALGAIGLSTNGLQWSRLFPARNTVTD